jgi:hypothetical protein
MASKIRYWDGKSMDMVSSREQYEELRHPLEYDEEVGDYYRHTETQRVTSYIHERTGIVTTDVRKFEKWLRKVEGR